MRPSTRPPQPLRPLLDPARRTVWRDESTLQLGADAEQAYVLGGIRPPEAAFLALLDGTRTDKDVLTAVADGQVPGLDAAGAARLLSLLHAGGVLLDASRPGSPRGLSETERRRLDPDLASWSFATDAADRLVRRGRARVTVVGAGRVGAAAAGLLAAASVGRVHVVDRRRVTPGDLSAGGHYAAALGTPRAASAAARAWAGAPSSRASSGSEGWGHHPHRPDLVLLCPDGPAVATERAGQLLADGIAHLVASTYEQVASVGPLVVPGRTPCLTCLDLHRVDRDPQWPVVCAQLAGPGRRVDGTLAAPSCDVVLAATTAALAVGAALAYLDAPGRDHELAGARLETRPPDCLPLRRSWGHHPRCGCTWGPAGDIHGARQALPAATMTA